MVLAGGNLMGVSLVLIVALIALAVMLILPRKMAKRSTLLGNNPVEPLVQERELEDAMQDLLVKLHDVDRDIHAKVDTKMASLNVLIEEADRKMAELRLMMGKMGNARDVPARKARPKATGGKKNNGQGRKHKQVCNLADAGEDVVSISRKTGIDRGEVELILQLRDK